MVPHLNDFVTQPKNNHILHPEVFLNEVEVLCPAKILKAEVLAAVEPLEHVLLKVLEQVILVMHVVRVILSEIVLPHEDGSTTSGG